MRIDATTLAVDGLRFVSPAEDGDNEVVFGKSGGVTGHYENGASGHIVDAQAHVLDARRATWRVGEGWVSVDDTARLQHVFLKLTVPSGEGETQLRFGADSAELLELSYRTSSMQLTATARLAGTLVERDAQGKLTFVAMSASLQDVSLVAGEMKLDLAVARVRKLSLISLGSAVEISVDGLALEKVDLALGDIRLEAESIDAARGVTFREGRLEVGAAVAEGLRAAYTFAPVKERDRSDAASDAKPASRTMEDFSGLDQIDGSVAAAVHLMAALPLVKDRGVTHGLRIPIDRGVISFGELEEGLSAVADALLDFEVNEDEIKLELDVIPVLKADNITLVRWPLTEQVDKELAAQKSMRLRKLLQFETPSSKEGKPRKRHDKGAIRLLSVDVEHVAVHLSARAPVEFPVAGGKVRLDDGQGHAIEALDVTGEVHLTLEGEPKRGALQASLRGVVGTLADLALGTAQLDKARVSLPRLDATLTTFDGARPVRIEATLGSLRLDELALDLVPWKRDSPHDSAVLVRGHHRRAS